MLTAAILHKHARKTVEIPHNIRWFQALHRSAADDPCGSHFGTDHATGSSHTAPDAP